MTSIRMSFIVQQGHIQTFCFFVKQGNLDFRLSATLKLITDTQITRDKTGSITREREVPQWKKSLI